MLVVCRRKGGWGCLTSSIKAVFQLRWKQFPAEGTFILKLRCARTGSMYMCVSALFMLWNNTMTGSETAMLCHFISNNRLLINSLICCLSYPILACMLSYGNSMENIVLIFLLFEPAKVSICALVVSLCCPD